MYESTFQSVRIKYHNAEIKGVQKENLSEKNHIWVRNVFGEQEICDICSDHGGWGWEIVRGTQSSSL